MSTTGLVDTKQQPGAPPGNGILPDHHLHLHLRPPGPGQISSLIVFIPSQWKVVCLR